MKRQKLLTVKEFAQNREISIYTVYKWIKDGIIKGMTRYHGGPWLIPSNNLKITRTFRGRPLARPIDNIEVARETFNSSGNSLNRKSPLTYDEVGRLFEDGNTQEYIAQTLGVTRQRVQQIHARYFAPFSTTGRERRKKLTQAKWEHHLVRSIEDTEKLLIVKTVVGELGYEVEPLRTSNLPSRCKKDLIKVNGRLCGVSYSKISFQLPTAKRFYYRVNISRTRLEQTEFIIIITGEDNLRTFVIPSKVLLDTFEDETIYKMFYLPSEQLPEYNNQKSRIDWWSFNGSWDQLA